ncbi:YihY/virulence factor BrkB family protein [Spongiibacter sp. KMU-158]|uniref:YihY/virulence factor BrkB family protein n=1 Tax=Spongiibacter pelagi TaxID=2760804 RepID=A0A927C216_9GAMM|nr:YihY/virulence factor BrkB family protein [Spongiibacter pelagi]MBD2859299.1 YihY/virulence factor BrkB family protein [Spongiibacter pelagi]
MDKTLNKYVAAHLWSESVADYPYWRQRVYAVLRYVYVMLDDMAKGELTLRAMSLVYTTLLSLVPLLAVSFSVLKAFGMHNRELEPIMLQFLAPMGDKGVEITQQVIGFIDNVKISVLGTFGIALLFYTAISLIQKIESTFNFIWRLEQHRSIGRRVADYGSVMLIGPLLVFSALGLSATVLSGALVQQATEQLPFLAHLVNFATKMAPYLMIIAAFTFFYMFIPNTRVTLKAGVIGGMVSGVLFQSVGWGFGSIVVSASGSGTYAIYSSFALLILFMMWMYISWLILLVGSSVAFYVQHPEYVVPAKRDGGLSIEQQEQLALRLMALMGQRFYQGRPPLTASGYQLFLRTQIQGVGLVLKALERAGLVTEDAEEPSRYLPNAPLETMPVKKVLDAVRKYGTTSLLPYRRKRFSTVDVGGVQLAIENAVEQAIGKITVKEMALGSEAEKSAEKTEGDSISGEKAAQ